MTLFPFCFAAEKQYPAPMAGGGGRGEWGGRGERAAVMLQGQ